MPRLRVSRQFRMRLYTIPYIYNTVRYAVIVAVDVTPHINQVLPYQVSTSMLKQDTFNPTPVGEKAPESDKSCYDALTPMGAFHHPSSAFPPINHHGIRWANLMAASISVLAVNRAFIASWAARDHNSIPE